MAIRNYLLKRSLDSLDQLSSPDPTKKISGAIPTKMIRLKIWHIASINTWMFQWILNFQMS